MPARHRQLHDLHEPEGLLGSERRRHTFSFRAIDAAGNSDATPATRTLTVDTPPDTTIDSGPAEGSKINTNSAAFTFHGTAGGSGKLECKLESGNFRTCTSPKTFSLSDGTHTVSFRAIDATGNTDATPATRTFRVDAKAPETTMAAGPAAGSTISSNSARCAFQGTCGDTSRLECKLDYANFTTCTSPKSFSPLSDGNHTVSFRAIDAAGNIDATPATRTFKVDTTAPETTIDSGSAAGSTIRTRSATFAFHGTAATRARSSASWTRGLDHRGCPKKFADLANGSHTVSFRATDAVGNTDATPATQAFTVDPPAPDRYSDGSWRIFVSPDSTEFSGRPPAARRRLLPSGTAPT